MKFDASWSRWQFDLRDTKPSGFPIKCVRPRPPIPIAEFVDFLSYGSRRAGMFWNHPGKKARWSLRQELDTMNYLDKLRPTRSYRLLQDVKTLTATATRELSIQTSYLRSPQP